MFTQPYTNEELKLWSKDITKNPRTGETLNLTINLYKLLASECKDRITIPIPGIEKIKNELPNNEIFIKILKQYNEYKQIQSDKLGRATTDKIKKEKTGIRFAKMATEKAINIIKNLDFKIKTEEDISKINGIGAGTIKKLKEILKTGDLEELKPYKEQLEKEETNEDAYEELIKIHGIGEVTAKQLISQGITNIKDLRKANKDGVVELNANVIVGLKYYEDLVQRIPRDEMEKFEKILKNAIGNINKNLKLTIAGSYRRGSTSSGDIDALITTTSKSINEEGETIMNDIIDYLKEKDLLIDDFSFGSTKYMGIIKLNSKSKARHIDIRFIPQSNFPAALLYFTGSGKHNIMMRNQAIEKGYKLNEYNLLKKVKDKFKPVKVKNEKDIFEILDLEYLKPEDREFGK